MRNKSILTEARQIERAVTLINLGARLQVLESDRGFYLGTLFAGLPFTRESEEYWPDRAAAMCALGCGLWTQRQEL